MSRVIKYAALVVMITASLAFAKKTAAAVESSSVQMSLVECPENEEGRECLKLCVVKTVEGKTETRVLTIRDGEIIENENLAELCDAITTLSVIKDDSDSGCKMVIVSGIDTDSDTLIRINKLEDESLIKICVQDSEGENGKFKAIIIHDGEVQKFEDRVSFEEYIKSHPELDIDLIELEDCIEAPEMVEPIIEPEPSE